ncbi:MAG: PilT/PilU family type 4a pilus ATPase [Patescibacteria group bacterium]
MKTIKKFFDEAIKKKASDILLAAGEKPFLRIEGDLVAIDDKELNKKDLELELFSILNAEQKKKFQENLELDFAYEHNKNRFRVNFHYQEGGIAMSGRLIPQEIPTPEDIRLEENLLELVNLESGLVLVVGATGNGKSTTIATILEEINKNKKEHIITIEDPIEFLFNSKQSMVEQREIGIDTKSFAEALKHVLRQNPDIIFIGEMRDPETIATALTAAETGHLVFSTLHTFNAAETIKRIVDVFEGPKQKQVLSQLSSVLRVVVAQKLLKSKSGKQVVAREILVNNSAIANMIKENNLSQIVSAMQTGAKDGMKTMDTSLKELIKSGEIDKEKK